MLQSTRVTTPEKKGRNAIAFGNDCKASRAVTIAQRPANANQDRAAKQSLPKRPKRHTNRNTPLAALARINPFICSFLQPTNRNCNHNHNHFPYHRNPPTSAFTTASARPF
jgi:hypothetical protein